MPRHTFFYTPCDLETTDAFPNGHTVNRTLITVSLRNGDFVTDSFYGIVDSGADYCMFPASLLGALGIDRNSLRLSSARGLGEDRAIMFATVKLDANQLGAWPVYAAFSDQWNDMNHAMLGHCGFLERFRLSLDPSSQIFELEDVAQCPKI
jgi:hypothetical protein